jgi:hypothetical protein
MMNKSTSIEEHEAREEWKGRSYYERLLNSPNIGQQIIS